jgi:hypothetical protein
MKRLINRLRWRLAQDHGASGEKIARPIAPIGDIKRSHCVKFTLSRVKSAVVGSKVFRGLFLFVALFFVKPLDFLPGNRTALSGLIRRGRVLWLPFLPASMFAKVCNSLLVWTAIHMQAAQRAPEGVIHRYFSCVHWVVAATAAMVGVAIYGFASARYIFHRALVWLWHRLGHPGATAPLNYYVVNTAAWATWFAAFSWAIESMIERYGIDFRQSLNGLIATHEYAVIAFCFAVYFGLNRVSRNRRDGMTAVYGGSRARLMVADSLACVLAVAALVLVGHLGFARATGPG